MKAPDQIADLLFKYLRNDLSPEEKIQLESWRKESSKNEDIFQKLTDPEQLREFLKDYNSRRNAWDKIVNLAPELKSTPPVRKINWWPISIAAAVLIIVGLTIFIRISVSNSSSKNPNVDSEPAINKTKDSVAVVQAVTNKAMLTLSNGQQIFLDSSNRSDIKSLGNNISELNNGKLLYQNTDLSKTDSMIFNILKTPRGGQFHLSLPDGSQVWLNAASMIKYPIAFNGKERKVEIEGEAYFEVAKNANLPFIVKFGNNQVQVLGTHFNINSYIDEPTTSVALLEGRVKVQSAKQNKLLVPGEIGQISNGSSNQNIEIKKVTDISETVSWTTGRVLFKDADVQSIMRKVSRWYNLDVVYQGNIPERSITGGLSKNESLSELLKVLEWNKIHYTIKGNQITITP